MVSDATCCAWWEALALHPMVLTERQQATGKPSFPWARNRFAYVLLDVVFGTRGHSDSCHQYRHSRQEWKALLDYLEILFFLSSCLYCKMWLIRASNWGQSKTCFAFLWKGVPLLAAGVIFALYCIKTKESQPRIRAPLCVPATEQKQ